MFKLFDVEHALNYKKRISSLTATTNGRDNTANLLQEVTNDVQIEPSLKPRTGEVFRTATNSIESERDDIAAQSV